MKDINKSELGIGDKVACCLPKYSQLRIGTITGFTEKASRATNIMARIHIKTKGSILRISRAENQICLIEKFKL